jgi:hypothetical protein
VHLEVLGGADVGASCLVLAAAGRRILIDAGIRLGSPGGDLLPDLARLQEDGCSSRRTCGSPAGFDSATRVVLA